MEKLDRSNTQGDKLNDINSKHLEGFSNDCDHGANYMDQGFNGDSKAIADYCSAESRPSNFKTNSDLVIAIAPLKASLLRIPRLASPYLTHRRV